MFGIFQNHPVAGFDGSRVAGTLFLLLHFCVETFDIGLHIIFAENEFGQIQGETVSIVERENIFTIYQSLAGSFLRSHHLIEQLDTGFECTQECFFLFFDNAFHQSLLSLQFGISTAHRIDERGQETIQESLTTVEESVTITHRTTQNTTNHITGFGIRRQLSIGDREGNGTDMVGNHAHSDIHFFILTVSLVAKCSDFFNNRLENVGIVIRSLALNSHTQTFEAHTGIDMTSGQRFQRSVGLAVELHEHEVPDFNYLRMTFVHQAKTVYQSAFAVGTKVDMNFRARTARTRIAHFPEVVVLVTINNTFFGKIFCPNSSSFVVTTQAFGGTSFEHGGIQTIFVELQYFGEIFPSPVDGFLLEIIAKRPVAQHFEHGMMIGIVTYFFQVVVLTADAQTFLRVGHTRIFRRRLSQENILELVHTGIGKHQSGVVLHYHRSRRHNLVSFRSEKTFKRFTNFFST